MADVVIPDIYMRIGSMTLLASCIAALIMGALMVIDIAIDKNKGSLAIYFAFASLLLGLATLVIFLVGIIATL